MFREDRRPVARGRGVVRFLAAAVLAVTGLELLLQGSPNAAAAVLGVAALSAGWCAKAVAEVRSSESVSVLHCHHCSLRSSGTGRSGPSGAFQD